MTNLHKLASHDRALREALERQFPGLEEDEQALFDTLDGLSDFTDAVRAVMKSRKRDMTMAKALELEIEELTTRKARLEDRADRKQAAVLSALESTGRNKVECPECTVSIAATPPRIIITDERAIPEPYLVWPEPRPDKNLMKKAIKDGYEIPGVVLSNGGTRLNERWT